MTATLLGVGEKEWVFKTTFTALDIDGLDTFARATLVRPNTQSCFSPTDVRPTEWCENIGVYNIYHPFTTETVLTAL